MNEPENKSLLDNADPKAPVLPQSGLSRQPGGSNMDSGTARQSWKSLAVGGVSLALLTLVAYLPALRGGFIWDDDFHLTDNLCIIGPLGFKAIWTSSAAIYYPLVLTSFWLQHALWGLQPLPYHLVNIVMHGACAVLLWRVLLRLNLRGAWFGAALWALHPVQAESVAWITELKNTQSCFFYLLAILFFVKSRVATGIPPRSGAGRNYALALLCAVLAILSKPSTVMLPVVFGLCVWWIGGRWRWRDVASLWPFFLISAVASGWTIWEQQYHSGALGPEWAQSGPERVAIAGKAGWFYLGKLLWPHPLIFIYPRWNIDASRAVSYLPVLATAFTFFVLWRYRAGWGRPLFLAFAYFWISLFPVLGFFNIYFFRYSFVGDHFQYLASIGPLALAGVGMAAACDFLKTKGPLLAPAFCGTLLALAGVLTWEHAKVFPDNETLWRDTLAKNPGCWLAKNNVGVEREVKGNLDEAIGYYNEAIRLKPDYAEAYNNRGHALRAKGLVAEAIDNYRMALKINPALPQAYDNLGVALAVKGNLDEAIEQFNQTLRLAPNSAITHNDLGNTLFRKGLLDEAMEHYRRAIQINPRSADGPDNLGVALAAKGRLDEAFQQFQLAMRLAPNSASAYNNLGNILFQNDRLEEAMDYYRKALGINPGFVEALNSLGAILAMKEQFDDAIVCFREALRISPNNASAHNNLGHALVEKGLLDEAASQYQETRRLIPNDPLVRYNLGCVLARLGRRDEAVAQLNEALRLKPDYTEAKQQLRTLGVPIPE